MIDTEKDCRKLLERSFLVGVREPDIPHDESEEHLDELKSLVGTLGIPVVGTTMVLLRRPASKYLVGHGKAEEIKTMAENANADCLVFDRDLSPSQQRNWEKLTGKPVIDRREIILDIFAARATTKEASLQVELARAKHMLPRLANAWTHLSRQRGGAKGTRGEGEKQIEVDRRLVRKRISKLKRDLRGIEARRSIRRKLRERSTTPTVAIVGYTNAGKTSLLNALSGSDALAENKLFATLDPITRRMTTPNGLEVLLTDTVGFVRKLPHSLVEAFKSTLEEAALADMVILTLDAASKHKEEHRRVSLDVLRELGADTSEMVTVLNKIDLLTLDERNILTARHPDAIPVSARTGEGLETLKNMMEERPDGRPKPEEFAIPPENAELIELACKTGRVVSMEFDSDGVARLKAFLPYSARRRLEKHALPKRRQTAKGAPPCETAN